MSACVWCTVQPRGSHRSEGPWPSSLASAKATITTTHTLVLAKLLDGLVDRSSTRSFHDPPAHRGVAQQLACCGQRHERLTVLGRRLLVRLGVVASCSSCKTGAGGLQSTPGGEICVALLAISCCVQTGSLHSSRAATLTTVGEAEGHD